MDTRLNRARLLIVTGWVGSLWTIGYLVAPTLFKTLADTALAGTIAGQLFMVEAWFSIICGLVLIAIALYQRQKLPSLVLGMMLCTILGYFVLHPYMAGLRAQGLTNPDVKWEFGVLHGISSGIYLMQSVLGAMLVLGVLSKVDLDEHKIKAE
jgi:hypothetical protein